MTENEKVKLSKERNKRRRDAYLLLSDEQKEKVRERARTHSKKNKAKKTIQKRENVKKNLERTREVKRNWAKKNREKILESKRKYRKSIKGRQKARDRDRMIRSLKKVDRKHLAEISKWELELRNNLFYPCVYCLQEVPVVDLEIDHFFPLSRGGLHHRNNLVPSCSGCNNKKGCKNPFDFIKNIADNLKSYKFLTIAESLENRAFHKLFH